MFAVIPVLPLRPTRFIGPFALAVALSLLAACGSAPPKRSSSQQRNPASAVPLAKNLSWSNRPAEAPPADAANDVGLADPRELVSVGLRDDCYRDRGGGFRFVGARNRKREAECEGEGGQR